MGSRISVTNILGYNADLLKMLNVTILAKYQLYSEGFIYQYCSMSKHTTQWKYTASPTECKIVCSKNSNLLRPNTSRMVKKKKKNPKRIWGTQLHKRK